MSNNKKCAYCAFTFSYDSRNSKSRLAADEAYQNHSCFDYAKEYFTDEREQPDKVNALLNTLNYEFN